MTCLIKNFAAYHIFSSSFCSSRVDIPQLTYGDVEADNNTDLRSSSVPTPYIRYVRSMMP